MPEFAALRVHSRPFQHWIADEFIGPDLVDAINAAWPQSMPVETGVAAAGKGALLFPKRLPGPAQDLAAELFSPESCARLSELLDVQLLPDPWFLEGPERPQLGGGLHEIHAGGLLKVHVDFEAHLTGLRRVANLLVYLNREWRVEWGGALELHGSRVASILPLGGRAVLFRTTPESWHGHPHPLATPPGITRRSLALYYYAADPGGPARPKTVYRSKR